MALTNGDIYKFILFAANKSSIGGYIRPTDYNNQLKINSSVLLREVLGITNDWGLGQPISQKQKGYSTLLDDKTKPFKKRATLSFSGGVSALPSDYYTYDSIRVDGALEGVEVLFGGEVARRLSSYIDVPDTEYPVGEFVGDTFEIYPSTILSAKLIYYRNPITPVFDYYIDANGVINYLDEGATYILQTDEVGSAGQTSGTVTSSSVEMEWRDQEKMDIAWMICRNFGINIQRQDLTTYALQIKGSE